MTQVRKVYDKTGRPSRRKACYPGEAAGCANILDFEEGPARPMMRRLAVWTATQEIRRVAGGEPRRVRREMARALAKRRLASKATETKA